MAPLQAFFSAQEMGDDEDEVVLDSNSVTAWLAEAGARRARQVRADSLEELRSRLDDA